MIDIDAIGYLLDKIEDSDEPWDVEVVCGMAVGDDVRDDCTSALVDNSLDGALAVANALIPGRTIEIIIYDEFTGCRIAIPNRESCYYAKMHAIPAHAVLITVLGYLVHQHG
jgi:hypothetical protein